MSASLGNTISCDVSYDRVSDRACEATDLVDLFLSARRAQPPEGYSHLSEVEIRAVISTAYRVSLMPEEGRYPRVCITSYHHSGQPDDFFCVAKFSEPIAFSAEALRKLSPAFPGGAHKLIVISSGGSLYVVAVESSRQWFFRRDDLSEPSFKSRSSWGSSLEVIVDGPASIRVIESALGMQLRGGVIRDVISFTWAHPVMELMDHMAIDLRDQLLRDERVPAFAKEYRGTLEGRTSALIANILETILINMEDYGHGGTFVVLANREDANDYINLKYQCSWPLLGETLVEWCVACINAWGENANAENLAKAILAKNRVREAVQTLASMTQADLCVVVDHRLNLLGFGGEIIASADDAERSKIIFTSAKSGLPFEDQSGEQFGGTRHRSAYRLCKTVPGTTVFVMSQDGDLSVFASSESVLVRFHGLSPHNTVIF
jgi:hypothetical protein